MKKIVSLLLTVVMLATMLSVFALPAIAERQTIDGSNITWELTENGTVLPDGTNGLTLTIGGTGAMPGDRPWENAISTITDVIIKPGVTSICRSAFLTATYLTNVTIPSSVTSIGPYAFCDCRSLKSVTIPYGVTSIASAAFCECRGLTSVTIPSSITSIDHSAFEVCTSLSSVTIPSSVTNISTFAFNSCNSLSSLTVKASTPPALGSYGIPSNAKLIIYVPYGTGSDYKSADNWENANIQEAYIVDGNFSKSGTITVNRDCFPASTFEADDQTVTLTAVSADGHQLSEKDLIISYKDGETMNTVTPTQDETDLTKFSFTMPKANVTVGFLCDCEHDFGDGIVCQKCGVKKCFVGLTNHTWDAATGKCSVCNIACNHDNWNNGICAVCQYKCTNAFHDGVCPNCGMGASVIGSILSEGSLVIICTVAAAVVFGLGGFLLGTKKKKKPALADGAEEKGTEE